MKLQHLSFLVIVLLFACISSCKHSDNPERNKVYDEMMAVHDEVMPEMKTIHYLRKNLKKRIAITKSPDSLVILNAAINQLTDSDDAMMDWMHNLDVPGKKVPDEEAIAYMKKEKQKINNVSVQMKDAIKAGKKLLGE